MGSEHDVSTRHLHVTGGITSSFIGLARVDFVSTQRTSNLLKVGSENHPIKKVAITIDTSRSHIDVMLVQGKSAYRYEICCKRMSCHGMWCSPTPPSAISACEVLLVDNDDDGEPSRSLKGHSRAAHQKSRIS